MTGADFFAEPIPILVTKPSESFTKWCKNSSGHYCNDAMIALGCWYVDRAADECAVQWIHVEQDGYKFDVICIQKESERGTNNAFIILPNGKAFLQSDIINTNQRTLKEWQELYNT